MKKKRDKIRGNPSVEDHKSRTAEALRWVAFAVLLACGTGRMFIAEMPFRSSPVKIADVIAQDDDQPILTDKTELSRAVLACVLLGAVALWLLAGAIEGKLAVRGGLLGAGVLIFAVGSAVSMWYAVDRRSAQLVWIEQFSLLAAGFLAVQLCGNRRRFVLLVVTLTALAAALAVKGLYEYGWEHAENVRYFDEHRPERLSRLGVSPDDPKERLLARRMYDTSVKGFTALANIFAAAMVILLSAAVGLAGAKIIYARYRRKRDGPLPKGEISTPTLAAVLVVVVAIPIPIVLLLTRSRGGILAAAIVTVAMAGLWRFRRALAARWRRVALVCGSVFLLGTMAVAACGLARDRLPSLTMTFRWFYWTGGAELVAEHPWVGVGPGNFANEYLRVRRPEAEEEVKTPHNVLVHAMTQYGVPTGTVYLAILGAVLVLAWRPGIAAGDKNQKLAAATKRRTFDTGSIWLFGAVVIFAAFLRWWISSPGDSAIFFVVECIFPAGLLACMLALARWFGGPVEDLSDGAIRWMRLCLAGGATAFVLHNMVSYGLWMPGAALLFWLAAGGAVGQGSAVRWVSLRRVSLRRVGWPVAAAGVAGVIVTGVVFVLPVYRRLSCTEQMTELLRARNLPGAIDKAVAAADADPLDAISAMEVVRLRAWSRMLWRPLAPEDSAPGSYDRRWAAEAIARNRHDSGAWILAGEMYLHTAKHAADAAEYMQSACRHFGRAVELNPSNGRMRLQYARVLLKAGRRIAADEQIDAAEKINTRIITLTPQSLMQFGPTEKAEIKRLKKIRAAASGP